jgi:Zn-dependent M28 family amino/carboxypeptidase
MLGVVPGLRALGLLGDEGVKALFEGAPRSFADAVKDADGRGGKPFELPVRAEVHTVTRINSPGDDSNVVAKLVGSDPRLRDQYVVLSAHLDHLGIGEAVGGDAIYNGAYDNASGIAALLEAAGVLGWARPRPRRSILFLAVTGEERGLLGSERFAELPTVAGKLVADVNLDGLLMLYPPRDVVAYGAEHSSIARIVQRAADMVGLTLSPDPWPEQGLFVRSDQYSFVRRGVPSVFVVPGFASADVQKDGGALTREWLRTVYHSPKDDAGQPMDLQAGARLVRLNLAIAWLLANDDAAPSWNRGDFFGQAFGGH